jgi:hypothetical protein
MSAAKLANQKLELRMTLFAIATNLGFLLIEVVPIESYTVSRFKGDNRGAD